MTYQYFTENVDIISQEQVENVETNYRDLDKIIKAHQDLVVQETIKVDKELALRVQDSRDLLQEYQIDIASSFYLREDDQEYDEDDDNDLAVLFEDGKAIALSAQYDQKGFNYRWGDTNHNTYERYRREPLSREQHCWWFHCLAENPLLEKQNLLRIGDIGTDVNVIYQYSD